MIRSIIAATVLVALAGCAKPTLDQSVADSCKTAAAALRVASTADRAGMVTTARITTITNAGTVINRFCSPATPPTDISGAVSAVALATLDLIRISQ